jgi:hypothetical protein
MDLPPPRAELCEPSIWSGQVVPTRAPVGVWPATRGCDNGPYLGVLDFVLDTDFSDVRNRCAIHADAGSIVIVPIALGSIVLGFLYELRKKY